MSLEVSTSEKTLSCQSCANCCSVTYSWDYTPILHYMVPAMVYPGMKATVVVDVKMAYKYKHENQLPIDLRIDGTSMNLTENYNSTVTLDANHRVRGIIETTARNETG